MQLDLPTGFYVLAAAKATTVPIGDLIATEDAVKLRVRAEKAVNVGQWTADFIDLVIVVDLNCDLIGDLVIVIDLNCDLVDDLVVVIDLNCDLVGDTFLDLPDSITGIREHLTTCDI